MKKNHHKYFRNQRYKQKLNNLYEQSINNWWSGIGVMFVSNQETSDPSFINHGNKYYYWDSNRSNFRYFDKPDVEYSPILIRNNEKGNSNRKWLKNYCNRKIRRNHKEELCQRGTYKKLCEFWWELY